MEQDSAAAETARKFIQEARLDSESGLERKLLIKFNEQLITKKKEEEKNSREAS